MAVAAMLLASCGSGEERQMQVRSVRTTHPQPMNGDVQKRFAGVVKEYKELSVGFRTGGNIDSIKVKEGDYVRAGQVIATLDSRDYRLGVEAYQIQYDQLRSELARMEKLYNQQSVSKNDYEKAKAGLEQLGVQLQTQRNKLEYTVLRAPVSGYVQSVNFEPSEMIQAGAALVKLLDVSALEVEVEIPSSLYVKRDLLRSYSCFAGTDASAVYPLTLVSINPKASSTQLYKLTLRVGGASATRLTPGMNVTVDISMADESAAGVMALPANAVFNVDAASYVWVVSSDTTLVRREVKVVGIQRDGAVLIDGNVSPADNVVAAGAHTLQQGEKVRVIAPVSETNIGGLM